MSAKPPDDAGPDRAVPVARQAYGILAMLFLFQTLNFFDKLVFGLSAVPLMHDLDITPKQYGLIGSLFFLLYSVSGTVVGLFVIGRVRVKWILVALALTWTASQLPMLFTTSLAVVAFCRLLLGVGEGPGLPTALHACYDWFPKERRSVPSAVVLQGISAGFLIGSPVLTYVILHHGWRAGFLACAVLGTAWTVGWLIVGAEGPLSTVGAEGPLSTVGAEGPLSTVGAEGPLSTVVAASAPDLPTAGERLPARLLWLDPTVLGVILLSFASYWVVGMSAIWLPPFLQLGLGYAPQTVGWIISAVFAFQSPLLLGGSWVCQRMQRQGRTGRVSLGHASTLALLAAGLALAASVHVSGPLQLVLVAVAFAAPSLTTIYGPVALGNVAPAAQRGTLIVVIYSGNASAALLSTYLTGVLVDAAATKAQGFAHAMTLAAAVLIAGALASLLLVFPERTIQRFRAHRLSQDRITT